MLLIIAAVPLETSVLRRHLQITTSAPELYTGQTATGVGVTLRHTGIGPTSTALNLTRILERNPPQAVLMTGCGGSYPHSGLGIGDLALATAEIFGDLGVMTAQGFEPLEAMDLPVTPPPIQRIQLQSPLRQASEEVLADRIKGQQMNFLGGPFVTVSTCSGHPGLSRELESRTGGICENMEGAAAAQVCAHYQIPFLELRGISNPTGTRDPGQWDLKRGAHSAQWAIMQILDHWTQLEKTTCSS